jgi:hypothetical protein
MQTLLNPAPAAKASPLEIKGATYAAEPIDPGFAGTAAVRVTKLVSGDVYDVVLGHDGVVSCSCPSFVCRHEGKGSMCKHGAAMVVRGFLPTTDAPTTMPGYRPAPVTRKDQVRASYFGLKLPTPPAPASIAAEVPAVAPVEESRFDSHVLSSPDAPIEVPALATTFLADPDPTGPRPTHLGRFTPTAEEDAGVTDD